MSSTNYDVVALGELLIDFTENGVSAQGNPVMEANPGGAPCNVLAMLRKMGREVAFIGKVGDDMFGAQLEQALVECGIVTEGLVKSEEVNTTLAFVHTLEGGEREFSFYRKPGADMMLSAEEVDARAEMIRQAKVFHFGSLSMTDEVCRAATRRALEIAKEAGALITYDPNLREPLWSSLELAHEMIGYGLSMCDVVKISDNEIQWFTGEEDFDAGVEMLFRECSGIKLVLLTMGIDGSRAYTREGLCVEVQGFPQENTIDTTGAGDTFCGMAIDYLLGYNLDLSGVCSDEACLREMLTRANVAAALVTTRKGALRVMPTVEEIIAAIQN